MAAPRSLPREVYVLSVVAFFVAVGFGILAPAIPDFAREFGVGRTAAALVVSAFAFMRLVSAFGSGGLVDRFGERWVMAIGIGIVATTSAAAGLSQNYPTLLILRGLGGVGSAMFTVSAAALLIRLVSNQQRGQASGIFAGGFLTGGIIGPVFGGPLTQISLRLPFFVYAATLALAGLVAAVALRNTALSTAPVERRGLRGSGVGTALRDPAYRAAVGANLAVGWAVFGVRFATIPLFVTEGLQLGAAWTGVGLGVFAAANALLLWPAGRFTDRRGRRPVLIGGTATVAVAMGLLVLPPALPLFLASMVIAGAGSALLTVAPAAVLGDVAPARSGSVVAVFQMSSDVGAMTGPLLANALVDSFGYEAGFGVTALVMLMASGLAVLMPETRDRNVSAPPVSLRVAEPPPAEPGRS
ncbi:MAG: MFS transporter [Geodermatophilaceae bacterium]